MTTYKKEAPIRHLIEELQKAELLGITEVYIFDNDNGKHFNIYNIFIDDDKDVILEVS